MQRDVADGNGDGPGSTLADYLPVLAERDGAGQPFVIVGGQAVNFWADQYLDREPRLAAFRPFISKDLDLVASTEDGQRLAAAIAWEFVPPEPGANVMRGKLRHGPLLVELLRPERRDLLPPTTSTYAYGETTLAVRPLSPVILLEKKLALAVDIPQDGSLAGIPARQDVRHVQMLALVLPRFLDDLAVQLPDEASRQAAMQPVVAILASLRRRPTGQRFETAYPGALPWNELLPESVQALPFDDVHRRCVEELGRAPAGATANLIPAAVEATAVVGRPLTAQLVRDTLAPDAATAAPTPDYSPDDSEPGAESAVAAAQARGIEADQSRLQAQAQAEPSVGTGSAGERYDAAVQTYLAANTERRTHREPVGNPHREPDGGPERTGGPPARLLCLPPSQSRMGRRGGTHPRTAPGPSPAAATGRGVGNPHGRIGRRAAPPG